MFFVQLYPVAVVMCFVTMLCWGSWTNTQKLTSKEWRFQLFYWDYAVGVFMLALIFAFTFGSMGSVGRSFLEDMAQADMSALRAAFIGGVVFNLANILVVAAIDIAGMAVAFPVGIGLALIIGVILNYIATPLGNPVLIFLGVAGVTLAIIVDAVAYKRMSARGRKTPAKGIVLSITGGILMGFFYRIIASSMSVDFVNPEIGKLGPYSAVVVFSAGLLASNFIWNSIIMLKPFDGEPVPFGDYFTKGSIKLHMIGLLGGMIWCLGMSFSILASGTAGFPISYGLGQGSTLVGACWGVFVWKEFKDGPPGTNMLLAVMFVSFIIGLGLIVLSRFF